MLKLNQKRRKSIFIRAAILAGTAFCAQDAYATDGYFLDGVGASASGSGGVAIAMPQDSLAIATNPATATALDTRIDVGVEVFAPDRSTTIHGNAFPTPTGGMASLNGYYSGNGSNPFVLPNLGVVKKLSPSLAVGLAIYGNGGMDTNYKTNPFANFGAQGNAGVDLKQIFITPTVAKELTYGQSIGISPTIAIQSFRATGIQPFTVASADPAHFTNLGESWSAGVGFRVGYYGNFGGLLGIGAYYQSKVGTGKFGKYAGLFNNSGSFDIPSNWGVGISTGIINPVTIGFDYKRINYSDASSVSMPLAPLFTGVPFGAVGGPGFGWKNISVFKIGMALKATPRLTLRAGYSHSGNPVQASQTFLNILAPGVVQDHLTLGASWNSRHNLIVTGYLMHALRNTVAGNGSIPANYGGGEADVSLSETSAGISLGFKL
ncbi:MAG: outer membrane protein transport protein [Alphaproteobacteria bacterium]|nr:outer membrane protein transport protein [Alphaproteobacteria bacterium]